MSLRARLIATNVVLVAAATLVGTFAACKDPMIGPAAAVAVAASIAAGALTVFLLARGLGPLDKVISHMDAVDLSEPSGKRVPPTPGATPEVERLRATFNTMLERIEEERRAAGRAVLRAQEQERASIAQDLHDEVNQALTGILLRLQVVSSDAPPQLAKDLDEIKDVAHQAMEELLVLARKLRPTVLNDHGLIPALHTQVQEFGRKTGVEAHFNRHGVIPPLDEETQLTIFRVCQESLSNITKYANATRVDVDLSFTGRPVLRIADNGYGFDALTAGRNGSLGLSGMKERALLMGGRLNIYSRQGQGTTVELSLGGRT